MKKEMTLSEVKGMFGEKCFETDTSFGVNQFGKYNPNITFILPKAFDLGKNSKAVNPIAYVTDSEVTDNMNIEFDGAASFIFGDFWHSKKGGACFRPKNPMQAKHLLIRVDWGGCFDSHRGTYPDEAAKIEGVLYFRRASSNGGGSGYDYWVVPVDFRHVVHDAEIDGNVTCNQAAHKDRIEALRKTHADLQRKVAEEADAYLKEKALLEEASRAAKRAYVPRLAEIDAELEELRQPQKFGKYGVSQITFGDAYFELSGCQYLYNEAGLAKAEDHLASTREWIRDAEARKQVKADVRADFEPRFEALRAQIEAFGWELSSEGEDVQVKQPAVTAATSYQGSRIKSYGFDAEGFEKLRADLKIESDRRAAEEAAAALEAAQAEARAMGLPSDIQIWNRSGATNAGQGYVIMPNGMDRPRDGITGDSRRIQRYDEGYEVWNQIMPGELVLEWRHAYTAAEHEFYVIYRPEMITEAQLERVAEIQAEIEEEFLGKPSLTGVSSCPSIGKGWGLF